jgi:hypothetical protein
VSSRAALALLWCRLYRSLGSLPACVTDEAWQCYATLPDSWVHSYTVHAALMAVRSPRAHMIGMLYAFIINLLDTRCRALVRCHISNSGSARCIACPRTI